MIFAFGHFELDEARWELRRDGVRVPLQPKTIELLSYLIHARDRVVSKDELLARVWSDSVVTESSLARTVSLARLAIDDRGAEPSAIQTVARRGYRFAAPVRVIGEAAARSTPEDDAGRSYVGREELRARLAASVDAALAGRGRILLLAGEAGIGKTRTAELLVARARAAGADVAAAWGVEAGIAPTLWTWARIVRLLADAAGGRDRSALLSGAAKPAARLLPDAAGVGADPVSDAMRRSDAERYQLFEAVHTFLARCAARRPLALVLDDLHALDSESLWLLEFVGHELGDLPIAVIATSRQRDASDAPERARALERLLRLSALEQWPLAGLSEREISEFVKSRAGVETPPELIEALLRKTGGNPLFLDAVARSLATRDLLRERNDVAAWEALLPEGIRPLLAQRLDGLSEATRAMLGCAAAIGLECERAVLEQAMDRDVDVDDCLREAERAGLLALYGADRLRFPHALVRDALLAETTPTGDALRVLRARIAEALERASGGSDEGIAERAHHACEAAPLFDPERAAELARRAGSYAARFHDYEGATSWYERAIAMRRLVATTDPAVDAELHLGLASAQTHAAGLDPARALYRRAGELAASARRDDLVARAALGFADRPYASGAGDRAVVSTLEAALARGLESPVLRTRMLSRLATELRYVDRVRAEALLEEALVAARALGDPATLAQALDDSTFVRFGPADSEGWLALNEEVVRVAREARDPELELAGHAGCWSGHLELGDLVGVDRALARCEAATADLRTPLARWLRAAARAMRALLDGRVAEAEERILESLRLAERAQSPNMDLQALVQLVYLRVEQGRAHEIESVARSEIQRFPDIPAWRSALAVLLAAAGRLDEARRELARLAREGFTDVPRDRGWLPTLVFAAEVAHATGDGAKADQLHALLSPYARLCVVAGSVLFYGSVSHHLGLLAATCRRYDEALASFERALDVHERIGARAWSARTQLAMAELLAQRRADGDAEQAADLAAAALVTARALSLERIGVSAQRFERPRLRAVPRP